MAPPVSRLLGFGTSGWLLAFLGAGTLTTVVYVRRRLFFRLLTWFSAAPVLFVGTFVLGDPARDIVFAPRGSNLSLIARNDPPVVFLLFDGASLGSLLTPQGEVDRTRFPNFGRLAGSTTWYRNATTAGTGTKLAVPSLLTGRWASSDRLPAVQDYPQNLFVAIGNSYRMNVAEWVTRLCPTQLCERARPSPFSLLLEDAAIVYGHVVLPPEIAKATLPPIDEQWSGFGRAGPELLTHGSTRSGDDRRQSVRDLRRSRSDALARFETLLGPIDSFGSGDFWFAHVGVPHTPWQFLPTGQAYQDDVPAPIPGMTRGVWAPNEYPAASGLQRYLLQLKLADRLLGRLVDRMEKADIWEDALFIVTADHGTSFVPGNPMRRLTSRNAGQILPVPLFIKYPGQTTGRMDGRFAELVDVMPTIADVLKIDVPWKLEGASLRGAENARPHRRVADSGGVKELGPDIGRIREVSRRIDDLFGRGGGVDDVYDFGPHRIVGRRVSDISDDLREVSVELDSPADYRSVRRDAAFVPAMVQATVSGVAETPRLVAVALNGRVAGAGWTYLEESRTRITVMVSSRYFVTGRNDVRVFEITAATRAG